ncbi:MAG: glycosyltransferase [Acidobacteria bacterium]|nr:MAG: glycosyltransferase [Acidobacteriota bacterium]
MKLGIVVDVKSQFVNDLLSDWRSRYRTDVFSFREIQLPFSQGRVNQWLLNRSLRDFLASHDLNFFEWAGPLLIAASRLGVPRPLVVRLHSYELFEYAPHINWGAVTKVILVSEAMRQRFVALYPDCAGKAEVIPNGVQLDRFKPANREFANNLGMLCELTPIKRVYETILTVQDLRKQGHCFRLHLAGEPPKGATNARYYAAMQSAVAKLDLGTQVIFYGQVQDAERWLRKIDVFVSNSFWEGHQVALIEAMASGCYCLSHFWDGVEEVLPSEYIHATDSELQQNLVRYSEMTESEKHRHHARMRKIAEDEFDLRTSSARFCSLFSSMVSGRRASLSEPEA